MRFIILFSMIIPISWRISLDFAKLVYKQQMTSDRQAVCCLLLTYYSPLATRYLLLAACHLQRANHLQAPAWAAGALLDAA